METVPALVLILYSVWAMGSLATALSTRFGLVSNLLLCTVIFLAGLQGIAQDLYEAAELDGSEGWRKHLDITLPLLRPYVTLVAVISAIAATKVFEEVYLMTQGGPADATRTLVYYVYDQAFAELEISYACTVGLALFVIVLLLSAVRFAFAGDRGLS